MRFPRTMLLGLSSALIATAAYGQAAPKSVLNPMMPPHVPSQLPAGHPTLPAGHPDVSGMAPTTRPASHGGIAVRAIQGTAGGPAIANKDISIELYHEGKVIRKIDGKLDDKGILVVEDLPLSLPFQPVVTLSYQGVEYQTTGPVLDSLHPNQQLELAVYETTDQAPAWQVPMRHVLVEPTPEGLKVLEMLAFENPSDRTWLGTTDATGHRATLSMPMPAGIQNLQFGGDVHECCIKLQGGNLVNTMPLQPGAAQMQLTYLIPAKDGQASFNITAPGLVKNMILFVPQDGAAVKVDGLQAAGIRETGKGKMQTYRGADLQVGHQAVVTATLPVANTAASPVKTDAPKVIAGVGAGFILVIGAVVVLLKTPKLAKAS
ncbi:MAG: hypothetical protein ACM359_09765 [Bacillota bacterium]